MERKVVCVHPKNVSQEDLQIVVRRLYEIFNSDDEESTKEENK